MKKNLLIIPLLLLMVIAFGTKLNAQGETCIAPSVVVSLPFNDAGNTSAYGDNYSNADVPTTAPGAITNGTGSVYYLTGDDVVYAYTPVTNEIITISTTNDDNWIGLWAFTGCPFASTVGYHTSTSGATRIIQDLPVIGGVTYYFVISSWDSHQSTAYTIEITALAACSGAPTAGTLPATEAVCAGYPLVLEATGSTTGQSGLTGQWQTRLVGSTDPWVDITGGTTNPYTLPAVPTDAMEYQYILSCGVDQDISNTMTTTINAVTDCYCEPITTNGCSNGATMNGVSTSGGSTNISNTATGCSGGYIDYTATHGAEVAAGTFFDITVDVTNYSGGVKVWIDFNQDGIFNASELVAASAATISSGSSFTETILVPAGAMNGETRMRVRLVESYTTFDACSTQSYGETEDYKFEITAAPSCLPPSALNTLNMSATSADLTWTENGSASEWQVEFGAPGFGQGTGTIESATSNPHAITITPNTAYEFYVRSVCGVGDTSAWSGPYGFSNIYCIPVYTSSSDYTKSITSSGAIANVSYATSSQPAGGYADETAQVIESYENQTFLINTEFVGGSNGIYIWVDWNNDYDFDNITELVASLQNSSATKTLSITVPTGVAVGDYRMRIRSRWSTSAVNPCETTSFGSAVDFTLSIGVAPSCLPTSNLIASGPTQTTVDLAWTENNSATTWNIEYGPVGFTPGTGTTISGVTTNPFTVTGLNPSSTYDFYVQSDCGGGDESAMGGFATESTACGVVTAPFYEGFNTGVQPVCWDNLSSNTTSTSINNFWKFTGSVEGGAVNNGKPNGTFAFSDGDTPKPDSMMLITPEIDLSALTTPSLGFEWFSNNTNNPGNNIPMIVSVFNGSTWTLLDTLVGDFAEWQFASYDLTPFANDTIRVRFMTNQTVITTTAWYNDILLDGVRIDNCLSGQNGSRDVCRLDSTINLNDNIVVGNHGGGTWTSPSLQPFIMNDSILNFSALPAGSHQIYYIERFACEESSIATINVFNTSSAGTGQSINVCKNEPINLYSALSGNVDLGGDWYDYTNALLPNSQPIAPNLSAQYNYFYIANNGVCPADTALIEVMVGNCVWSVDEELFTDISVYPNPATSLLNIVNPSNTASLKVEMLDMNGRVVLIENKALNNASEATIAIDHLERGFYTLRVYNNEGQRTFKIVKL